MNSITPQQLHESLLAGAKPFILDVRTPAEHTALHIPSVHNLPLDRLDGESLPEPATFSESNPLYIVCLSGGRAKSAAEQLSQRGYSQCCVVEGGTTAWTQAGLPVERGGEAFISLERQVRIAAGILVLSGAILAQFVHPGFVWLAGFVGAGLVFAGVSDWCGMGILIARMPWNQRTGNP